MRAAITAGGFSLIELIVAMALSLAVLGVGYALFDQLYDVSESATAMAEMNQNLRAGADMIARDLTLAGAGIPIGGIPLPGGASATAVTRPAPIAATFPAGTGTLSAITPGYNMVTIGTQQTDEVTVVLVNPNSTLDQYSLVSIVNTSTDSTVTVDSRTSVGSEVVVGDLVMFSNSNGTAMGMVTDLDTAANTIVFAVGDPLGLNQPAAESGTLPWLANVDGTYPPTLATKLTMVSYYLDSTDPAWPRLMRQEGASTPQPVALGITNLQVSYDLSDGVTVNVRSPATPNQIRKANLMISARSERRSRKSGQFFTNGINTAITIRNLAYKNKYA